jgi:hypothetical protein
LGVAFKERLQELVDDEIDADDGETANAADAPATPVTRAKRKADAVDLIGSLSQGLRLVFKMAAEGLHNTWSLPEPELEIHVLPFPRLAAALGPHCNWENIEDFTMTFDLPVQAPSARIFFNICGMLEAAL